MSCEQIIKFLNKYSITYIDSNTTVITESDPSLQSYKYVNQNQSSLTQFLMSDSRKILINNKFNAQSPSSNNYTPVCYLVKDMILEDTQEQNKDNNNDQEENNQDKLMNNALETLSMHQQLSNKYILTLLHYQLFTKYVSHQNMSPETSTDNYAKNCYASKQKSMLNTQNHLHTKTQQSTYRQHESVEAEDKHFLQFSNINNKNHPNFNNSMNTNLLNTHTNVSVSSFVNQPQTAIRAIYQYGKISLKEEIKNRVASNTQFQQEQLWAILATLVQALGYLEEQGIVYGVLGTDKIFINNSLVKLLDPSATATDPLLIAQGRLYSPQILNDEQNINMFKSDVYVTGLVLLQCALFVDLSKQVQPNLNKYLDVFRTVYSKQLVDIVALCLANQWVQRPSFQQLKHYLSKQLDMNDFQSAYDTKGGKLLVPMNHDQQDHSNPYVNEIQYEYEDCNCDILYESLGEQEILEVAQRRKCLTDFQKAVSRYLGISISNQVANGDQCEIENHDQSLSQSDMEMNKKQVHGTHKRMHSHSSNRPVSPSVVQTRRNSKASSSSNTNNKFFYNNHPNQKIINNAIQRNNMPKLNVAISQSIYPDQMPAVLKNNQNSRANKKGIKSTQNSIKPNNDGKTANRPNTYTYQPTYKQSQIQKQNSSHHQAMQLKRTIPHSTQKLKKTKLIKQKLVRNQEADQSFNKNNNYSNMQNRAHNQVHQGNSTNVTKNPNLKANKSTNTNQNYASNDYRQVYSNMKANNSKNSNHNYQTQEANDNNINSYREYNGYNNNANMRFDNQSIRQENQEQSESSCLYYNQNTNLNQNSNSNSIGDSKVQTNKLRQSNSISNSNSRNSQGNGRFLKASQRYQSNNANNTNNNTLSLNQNSKSHRTLPFMQEDQQIFTDPNFLQTIKQDLARISTTAKNIQLNHVVNVHSQSKDKWFK